MNFQVRLEGATGVGRTNAGEGRENCSLSINKKQPEHTTEHDIEEKRDHFYTSKLVPISRYLWKLKRRSIPVQGKDQKNPSRYSNAHYDVSAHSNKGQKTPPEKNKFNHWRMTTTLHHKKISAKNGLQCGEPTYMHKCRDVLHLNKKRQPKSMLSNSKKKRNPLWLDLWRVASPHPFHTPPIWLSVWTEPYLRTPTLLCGLVGGTSAGVCLSL